MGKFYDHIPDRLFKFIQQSQLFFVATAPLEGGSVNVSPKSSRGRDNFCTLDLVHANRVRYLDLTGSGNETISHVLQPGNGRITLMFVNIEAGLPNIVRLFGKAAVHEHAGDSEDFSRQWFGTNESYALPIGSRAIIDVAVHTCSTSCGYSMPVYEYVRRRTVLDEFFDKFEAQGPQAMAKHVGKPLPNGCLQKENNEPRPIKSALETYWALNNGLSIDGLPGMKAVRNLIDPEEQQKLVSTAKNHDAWQPPSENTETKRTTKHILAPPARISSSATSIPLGLLLGFFLGCITSFAICKILPFSSLTT